MHYSSLIYAIIKDVFRRKFNSNQNDVSITDAHWKDGVNSGVITINDVPHLIEIRPIKSQKKVSRMLMLSEVMEELNK